MPITPDLPFPKTQGDNIRSKDWNDAINEIIRLGNILEGFRIAAGRTTPGQTNWQVYSATGIYVDVDTSAARFTRAPVYITSIGGISSHWSTTGATSIYPIPPATSPTARGFRVHVRWVDNASLTPAQANEWNWHINWLGMEI